MRPPPWVYMGQAVPAPAPRTQKRPTGQAAQSACDAPPVAPRYEPASHSVTELAPAPHQPPALHGSHAVALGDDWNSPAAHATHALKLVVPAKEPGEQAIGVAERARQ